MVTPLRVSLKLAQFMFYLADFGSDPFSEPPSEQTEEEDQSSEDLTVTPLKMKNNKAAY